MNQAGRDALAVARERDGLHRQVVRLESELRIIGVLFLSLGDQLQADPPMINFDIESLKKAVATLPHLVSVYSQAAIEEADKNRELAKLTALQPCASPQTSRLLQELGRCPEIYRSTPVGLRSSTDSPGRCNSTVLVPRAMK